METVRSRKGCKSPMRYNASRPVTPPPRISDALKSASNLTGNVGHFAVVAALALGVED
jgi:hypothetical protein